MSTSAQTTARPGRAAWRPGRRQGLLCAGSALAVLIAHAGPAGAGGAATAAAAPPIQKVYGRTPSESSPPSWPQAVRAPAGAPNVLVIMTDDVGYGASSTYGGPVPTPAFESLARQGLRYTRFNTTAICSPTRASLLTGRNPQEVGVGYTTNWPTGYDGYNSVIPKSAGTVSAILRRNGYNTAMIGKGHITPEWEMSAAGPFDRWPTGLGFEYFYGFLGADTSAFEPSLVENTRPVAAPEEPGYHLERDLADHAIRWLSEQHAAAPDKPFFLYYAPAAAHAPNHAPKAWIERFHGQFDQGWDVLRGQVLARQKALGVIPVDAEDAPRPATLPAWSSLSVDHKRLYARYMEAYAASLAYADDQIGRVLESLRQSGELDTTLVIYIQGDNGGSAEGSLDGKLFEQSPLAGVTESFDYALAHIDDLGSSAAYNLYPGGWAWALNTPFQWTKRYASHFGGVRNAMVVSWPGHIAKPGGVRTQFAHVSDIMPTILEAAGVAAPPTLDGEPQQPITGLSLGYTLNAPQAPSRRTSQVFAMAQNLSLYRDGWVVATTPMTTPWDRTRPPPVGFEARRWELYDIDHDFSEAHDLAASQPQKLEAMKSLFWIEAAKAGILPIHASEGGQAGRPDPNRDRSLFHYATRVSQIPEAAAPPIVGRTFSITAQIDGPPGAAGVLCAQGGRYAGYSLFLDAGRPTFTYNLTPAHRTRIAAATPLAPGRHEVQLRFTVRSEASAAPAEAQILVDGKVVAEGAIERTFTTTVSHTEGFDVGQDTITAVDPSYTPQTSRFTGLLSSLTVQLAR
jgi:arylsulfatase A-like enzyme